MNRLNDYDQFGQGRKSVLSELKRYNLKEMQKLQKAIVVISTDKKDLKSLTKRVLLKGHLRQLDKIETLLNVKIKNLKKL